MQGARCQAGTAHAACSAVAPSLTSSSLFFHTAAALSPPPVTPPRAARPGAEGT